MKIMNKSMKKMFLFLGILIVVILLITVIYLLAQPGGDVVTPSPSASPSVSISPSPSETSSGPSDSPTPTDNGTVVTEETAEGTKYTVTVPGSFVTYSLVVDSKMFEHSRTDGSDTFMDVSEAGEYLSISFIEGSKSAALAPSFLDPLINYKEFEQSGKNYVPGTEIEGETVTANDGDMELEAWLVDTEDGVLAVVISYSLKFKEDETAKLQKILGTLTIME